MFWDSIYGLCQVSVHREGVNPSSREGVLDLSDHISVVDLSDFVFKVQKKSLRYSVNFSLVFWLQLSCMLCFKGSTGRD